MFLLFLILFSGLYYYLVKYIPLFSFQGRIARGDFFLLFFLAYVVQFLCFGIGVAIEGFGNFFLLNYFIFGSIILVRALRITIEVRRCHDLGHSGWNVIWLWIPIINLIIFLANYTKKGDKGPNEYGPDPLKQKNKNSRKVGVKKRV